VSDELINHTGNIKFDIRVNPADADKVNRIRQSINDYDKYTYAMLPSTHKGEEALLVEAYLKAKPHMPNLRLILAPRHPNRIDELKALLNGKGVSYTLFSDGRANDGNVLLVDTFGELMALYPLAELVIMGGSFRKAIGGHNILEPALFGIPVIIGKHYHNFRDIVKRFLKEDAIKVIPDNKADRIASALIDYHTHRKDYAEMGRRGQAIIKSGQGVTDRIAGMVMTWMDE
jgi:3-deoxy-D-manno-octulosonic-acid transferase